MRPATSGFPTTPTTPSGLNRVLNPAREWVINPTPRCKPWLRSISSSNNKGGLNKGDYRVIILVPSPHYHSVMGGGDPPDDPERFSGSQELDTFLERVRVDWAGLS